MGIQGIGANSYPMGYGAARTEKNKPEEANKSWTVKSESQGLILHGQETQYDD